MLIISRIERIKNINYLLGHSTFTTDELGEPYQFMAYLPFGETMAQQKAAEYSTRYRFTSKEQDEITGLYYFGARYYDPRISVWYCVDPMTSKMSSHSTFNYCFNNPIILIDPNGERPTPREAALIANHIYDGKSKLEGGWVQSTRTFGIESGTLPNGFRSMIYERMKADGKIEFVYALQGTNFTSIKDWKNNILQALGSVAPQYDLAINNAMIINQAVVGNDFYELTFVGHSLGGGLAAACAYATGNPAITFNAAGVNQETLDRNNVKVLKGSMNSSIQAYIMTTDPLNLLQNNNNPFSKSGQLGLLLPDVDGTRHSIPPTRLSSAVNGHSMNTLEYEILKSNPDKDGSFKDDYR